MRERDVCIERGLVNPSLVQEKRASILTAAVHLIGNTTKLPARRKEHRAQLAG
jgi:hypothetical protein